MSTPTMKIQKVCPEIGELEQISEKNMPCTVSGCDSVFPHKSALRMHLVKTHKLIQNEKDNDLYYKRKHNEGLLQYHCPISSCVYNMEGERHFSCYKYLKQHYMKVHAEKRFLCSKCTLRYALEHDCIRHEAMCGVVFRCETCSCPYSTREALLTHCRRKQHKIPAAEATSVQRTSKKLGNKVVAEAQQPKMIVVMMPSGTNSSEVNQGQPMSTQPVLGSVPKKGPPIPILPKMNTPLQIVIPMKESRVNTHAMYQRGSEEMRETLAPQRNSRDGNTLTTLNQVPQETIGELNSSLQKELKLYERREESSLINQTADINETSPQLISIAACCQTENSVTEQGAQTHNDLTLLNPTMNHRLLSYENQSAQTYHTSASYNIDNQSIISTDQLLPFTVSTGIQAQVVLGNKAAVETQTSGKYILQRAMENAQLPVLKRSKSSQASSSQVSKSKKTYSSHTQTSKITITKKNTASTNTVIRNIPKKTKKVRKSSYQKNTPTKLSPKSTKNIHIMSPYDDAMLSDFSQNFNVSADNETQTMALLEDLEATIAESISTQTLESYLTDNPVTENEILVQNSAAQTNESCASVMSSIADFDVGYLNDADEFQCANKSDLSAMRSGIQKTGDITTVENRESSTNINPQCHFDGFTNSLTDLYGEISEVNSVSDLNVAIQSQSIAKEQYHQGTHMETQTAVISHTQNHTQTMTFDDLSQISMQTQTLDLDRFCHSHMETQTLNLDSPYQSHIHTQTLDMDSFCQSNMETQTFDMEFCQTHNETQTVDEMFSQFLSHMETQTVENFDLTDFEFSDIQTQTSVSQDGELSMGTQTLLNSLDNSSVVSMDIETQTNLQFSTSQSTAPSQDVQLTHIETQTLFPELDLTDTYTQTHMSYL